MDGVLCQESRWGVGVNKRCSDDNRYWWGAVGGEEIKRFRKRLIQVGRGARIHVLIINAEESGD